MKYAALKYSLSKNIGDEIQTLAALKFLPKVDLFLDRDFLNAPIGCEKLKVILNGWFTLKPENWPPQKNIIPLITSFHITHKNNCLNYFNKKEYINYLKQFEPIGCRDLWTLDFLRKNGVDVFLSGCLTLTLKKEDYVNTNSSKKIYFVDIADNIDSKNKSIFTHSLIPDKYKDQIGFISHWNNPISSNIHSKLEFAKKILRCYANAKLVVTTRLHCLLPCIAFGIPVYFINLGFDSIESKNRFGGLIDDSLLINPQSIKSNYFLNTFYPKSKSKSLAFSIRDQLDWGKLENKINPNIEQFKIELEKRIYSYINNEDC